MVVQYIHVGLTIFKQEFLPTQAGWMGTLVSRKKRETETAGCALFKKKCLEKRRFSHAASNYFHPQNFRLFCEAPFKGRYKEHAKRT